MKRLAITLATLLAGASSAEAATISGTLTQQTGGAAVSGVVVRAWLVTTKGTSLSATATTNASGAYTITVAAGTYKVDARGAPAYTDRWYDVAAPLSGGYVAENADELVLAGADAQTGVDILMEIGGGGDGRVFVGGVGLGGPWVRMERKVDFRMHHNDPSDGAPVNGWFSFRGLPAASDYQMIIYDPAGLRDTLLLSGPFTVAANGVAAFGNRTMVNYAADPYEGNNTGSCASTLVDETALHSDPPVSWQTSSAYIGPRGSDPDWFCFQAVEGDRLLLTASTEFTFNGTTRYHPWTDPIMSWWSGTGTLKLAEDDDSGPGFFDSYIDTGPVDAGCYCIAISTFGDTDYNGSGQGSSGRYNLKVEMGNRPPLVKARKGTTEVPYSPATLTIAEGQTLSLNLEYPDADHDVLTTSFSHTDSGGTAVVAGMLNMGATGGDYTWTAGATAAANSPYTIVIQASDAEFDRSRTISLVVTAVNDPPELPTLVALIGGAVTETPTPILTIGNATDPDGDALTYDIELYYNNTAGAPAQIGNQAENVGTETMWLTSSIPENTRVFWRARANDGNGGVSGWTEYAEFLVDSSNDAPQTPVLIKPANADIIVVRRPGLAAINVTDPESEAIEFIYEISTSSDFSNVVWTSMPIPMSVAGSTTMTTADQDLAWGGTYFARVKARDARGAESGYSNVNEFQIKANLPPGAPIFPNGCTAETHTEAPPTFIEVNNVVDPEAETITFDVYIFAFADDPASAAPLLTFNHEMAAAALTTQIPFDASTLDNGRYRIRVRANDGTDTSAWIECDFTLDLVPEASPAGGCCQSGQPGASSLLGLLLFAFALRRRRTI